MYPMFARCSRVAGSLLLPAILVSVAQAQQPLPARNVPPPAQAPTEPHPPALPRPPVALQPNAGDQPAAPLLPLAPRVQQVLTQARQAYKELTSYRDLGTITTTTVVGGKPSEVTMPAMTTYAAPGKFISNYQAANLYSDGRTLWIYISAHGKYYQQPLEELSPQATAAPSAESLIRNLPILSILVNPEHNLLTTTTAFDSQYRGQEQLAGRTVDHITLLSPSNTWFGATGASQSADNRTTIDMYFDARTHMLLRLNLDMTGALRNRITQMDQQRGTTQIDQASWQFNVGQTHLNTPIAEETFAFKVPAEAERADTVAALMSATGGRPPVNDEELAQQREARQARSPQPAADFSLPNLAGRQVRLADLRGKVVVVDFWATWCGPCRRSLPHIQALYDEFKDRGVVVLGVDIGEDAKTVLAYAEKNNLSFPILLDEQDKVSGLYKVEAIPHTVLIDQKGRVVATHTGFRPGQEKVLRDEVEGLLAKASTQPAAASQSTEKEGRPAGEASGL